MVRHRKNVHFKDSLPLAFSCTICKFQCVNKDVLKKHLVTHSDQRDFQCDQCDKNFKLKGSLTAHIRAVHIAERNFICPVCGFGCKTQRQLVNHQVAHSDETPFKCKFCLASFKALHNLKSHELRMHLSDPVTCDMCGKKLKHTAALKLHMEAMHTGMDMPCSFCGKIFKKRKGLDIHVQTVHFGVKVRHECALCNMRLWSRKQIIKHIEEIHSMDLVKLEKSTEEFIRKYRIKGAKDEEVRQKRQ